MSNPRNSERAPVNPILNEVLGEWLAQYDDPGHLNVTSPVIAQAARVQAASAELLGEGDKAADPVVFGPEYSYKNDPKRKRKQY